MKTFLNHRQKIKEVMLKMQDSITELQKLEKEYLKQEEAMYVISEFANDWEYWQDPEGNYKYVSPSCETVTGYVPEDFYQDKNLLNKIIKKEAWERWQEHRHTMDHDGEVEPLEIPIETKAGTKRWIHHICQTVIGKDGKNLGIRGSNRDITQLKELQDKLTHMAGHDPLTGLPNRALFFEHLEQAIKDARRNKSMFVVGFLDLDDFKGINDQHGHKAGDHVLIKLAKIFTGIIRKNDIIARFGGDEFVAFFEVQNENDASVIKEKIMGLIPDQIPCSTYDITIRYSLGISVFPHDGTTADALLVKADQLMYAQKNRNKSRRSI